MLEIERTLLAMYADPALDHKPELLEQRGGAYYSEAAAALVTSLLTDDGAHHYVDVRNNATIAGVARRCRGRGAGAGRRGRRASGSRSRRWLPSSSGSFKPSTAYEVLAIEAAKSGSRTVALRALLANPLVRQWDLAVPMLDEILQSQPAPRYPRSAELRRWPARRRMSSACARPSAALERLEVMSSSLLVHVEVATKRLDREPKDGKHASVTRTPAAVSEMTLDRPSSGLRRRRRCRAFCIRTSALDSVVGFIPSVFASRVGVVGCMRRSAL